MADNTAIRKILFATDFSEGSSHAFGYAEVFARAHNAQIEVVHVLALHQADPEMASREMPKCIPEAAADLIADRQVVRALSPELGIIHTAREKGCDLIVMGTHGRTGLRHVFMGSAAERVVQLADCTVLTVRTPGHEFEKP